MDPFFMKSCTKKFTTLILKAPPFLIRLCYLAILSLLGFIALVLSKPKNSSVMKPKSLDVFFTSVSAVTVSSMSTIEMEVFSDTQLIILTFLMLFGGEIFTSMLNMLANPGDLDYDHLFPRVKTISLAGTVLGFLLVQFVMFCSLEWNSEATVGLNTYEKLVGTLLQVASSRHAGETVFDLSLVSSAMLVVFTVMMYFPPYTSLSPKFDGEIFNSNDKSKKDKKKSRQKSTMIECLFFSQLSYLVIFVVVICITEKEKMKEDPLNFNVFNILFEVISAYGNVGLSTCYSCERQMKPDRHCKDAWVGFVGRWSNKGKCILILVMFFGRFKNFTLTRGGKAWKLS